MQERSQNRVRRAEHTVYPGQCGAGAAGRAAGQGQPGRGRDLPAPGVSAAPVSGQGDPVAGDGVQEAHLVVPLVLPNGLEYWHESCHYLVRCATCKQRVKHRVKQK